MKYSTTELLNYYFNFLCIYIQLSEATLLKFDACL